MKTRLNLPAAALVMLLISGCAGHHGASALPPAATHAAKVQFTIKVPKAQSTAASQRHPHYISPATQAVQINAQAFNVTPSSPNCATQSSALVCTFTIDAPNLGQAYFAVTTYDRPLSADGQLQGNQLSTGTASANIVAGTANVVKVTTAGIPANATFTIANLTPPMGTPAVIPMTYDVTDADGYSIVGNYTTGLYFSQSTTGPGVQFLVNGTASGAMSSSGNVLALSYSGRFVGTDTITAMLGGVPIGSGVVFDPQPAFGAEIAVSTPLDHGNAYRDTGFPFTTYFTEPAKHSIGTIQTGAVVEFATPSGGTPGLLTPASLPPGAVFTESNNAIGAIGPSMISGGQTAISDTIETAATPNAGFYEIAQYGLPGSSEAITEYNAGKIALIINEGDPLAGGKGLVWTEFSTGKTGSTPAGIVATPNGWYFADPGVNAIGFMSTGNAFTYYPVPSSGAHPTDIVQVQGGDMWFTEPGVNKIGKIDTNNAITEYPCGGSPVAIVGQYTTLGVLTSAGNIDIYNTSDGTYKEYVPPASSSGPVVGIGNGGGGDIIVLRSNGSTGAVQDFFYE